jgi:hypothetical protein
LRVVLIVAAVIALVASFSVWIPLLFVAFVVYSIYWVFRAVVILPNKKKAAPPRGQAPVGQPRTPQRPVRPADELAVTQLRAQEPPAPGAAPATFQRDPQETQPPQPRKLRRCQHRKSAKAELMRMVAQKPLRERLTELTGSMLLSAVIAAVTSMVLLLLVTGSVPVSSYAWLASVGTLGSWFVMVPAKFFEGKVEDQAPKRFTLLILGMLLGLAAWGLSDALILELPLNRELTFDEPLVGEMMDLPRATFESGFNVPPAMFVGYFGFLLAGLRWWTQTEWTRYTRVNIWSLAVCVTIAIVLPMLWWFPQPAGALVAAVMALSIQLASPWLSMTRRREIVQQVHTA